jgi:hypothetical protein
LPVFSETVLNLPGLFFDEMKGCRFAHAAAFPVDALPKRIAVHGEFRRSAD